MNVIVSHRQFIERIQRCHLITFRQRRIIEHGLQEIVQISSEIAHGLPDVNQFGGACSDGVDTEEVPVLPMKQQLQQPAVVSQNLPACDLAVASDSGLIRDPLLG